MTLRQTICAGALNMFPYQDSQVPVEERISDLLSRMTVEEKIGQLCKGRGFNYYTRVGDGIEVMDEPRRHLAAGHFGTLYGVLRADWWTKRDYETGIPPHLSVQGRNAFQRIAVEESRLGIPILFAEEAPHGLMALGTSIFPCGLGMGSTWDTGLLERIGAVIGAESEATGIGTVYAPILDLAVEPRWSRTEECFSEDPVLVEKLSEAMTRGIRRTGHVEPTLKHFIGGGHPEGGHNALTSHLGDYELQNNDLRPFRASIRAGAAFVMSTYHDVDGEPANGSRKLLTDILREQLGFRGFVAADAGAIELLHARRFEPDIAHAAARMLKAGGDGDSGHDRLADSGRSMHDAYNAGLITDADLDRSAGRMLRIKFSLGLFEHPYSAPGGERVLSCPAHRKTVLEASRKSLVLLKNKGGILPFDDRSAIKTLAVIGPNADQAMNQLGDYTPPQKAGETITILAGLRDVGTSHGMEIRYAPGCGIRSKDTSGFAEACTLARQADAVVFVPGGCSTKFGNVEIDPVTGATLPPKVLEGDSSEKESGEGTDRSSLDLCGVQVELFRELVKIGKPMVVVPVMGRPLILNEFLTHADAVLCAWYPGQFGGQAVAEALLGDYNPGGKLPVSLPRNVGQLPVTSRACIRRRSYVDGDAEPLLPCGFGLSYTSFAYSQLNVANGRLSVLVQNVGKQAGDEVVQFYATIIGTPLQRPESELFCFERVTLQPGEAKTISTCLTDDIFTAYAPDGSLLPAPEWVTVTCGDLSIDIVREKNQDWQTA